MKKLIVLTIAIFLVACATEPPIRSPLPPLPEKFELKPQITDSLHTVKIVVESANDSKVDINSGDGIQRGMEIGNPEGRLSGISWICSKTQRAFTKIFSGLSVADVQRFWDDINWLSNNTEIREIHMFINSPGGDAFSGLALADEIGRAKANGFTITAHASGIIASAAVPIFASCSVRLAAPGTIFMVDEASLWKWPGQETASDIRSQGELMTLLQDKYMEILVKGSKLSLDEWILKEAKTSWFSAEKALEWGLVDRIE